MRIPALTSTNVPRPSFHNSYIWCYLHYTVHTDRYSDLSLFPGFSKYASYSHFSVCVYACTIVCPRSVHELCEIVCRIASRVAWCERQTARLDKSILLEANENSRTREIVLILVVVVVVIVYVMNYTRLTNCNARLWFRGNDVIVLVNLKSLSLDYCLGECCMLVWFQIGAPKTSPKQFWFNEQW